MISLTAATLAAICMIDQKLEQEGIQQPPLCTHIESVGVLAVTCDQFMKLEHKAIREFALGMPQGHLLVVDGLTGNKSAKITIGWVYKRSEDRFCTGLIEASSTETIKQRQHLEKCLVA